MSQPEVNAVNAVKPAMPMAEGPKLHAGFLKNNLREYGMLISLVAIMVLFQVLTDGTLLRPLNLTNLLLQNSYVVIMALGMLLVIVAGHIDLSVGSVCGFIGALAAVLMVEYEWHFVPTAIVSIAAGAHSSPQNARAAAIYRQAAARRTQGGGTGSPRCTRPRRESGDSGQSSPICGRA